MRLTASGYTKILNKGDSGELDPDNFYPPAPSPFAADCGQFVHCCSGAYVVPTDAGEVGTYQPRARIREGVFEIDYTKKSLLEVRDLPSNDGIEPNALPVLRGRRHSDKPLGTRGDVFVENGVNMQGNDPVKAGLQLALESPKSTEQPTFEWVKYNEGDESLEARLDDLEDFIKHESPHYPFG
jgi:hypothetical protein